MYFITLKYMIDFKTINGTGNDISILKSGLDMLKVTLPNNSISRQTNKFNFF